MPLTCHIITLHFAMSCYIVSTTCCKIIIRSIELSPISPQVTLQLYSEQQNLTSHYIGAHMSHHHQGIPTLNWNLDQIPTLLHVCGGLDEEDGNGAD